MRLDDTVVGYQRTGDEGVLLHYPSSSYFTVTETGAFLLSMLSSGDWERDALVEAVQREYEVAEAVCAEDVDQFLRQLLELNCLELSGRSE